MNRTRSLVSLVLAAALLAGPILSATQAPAGTTSASALLTNALAAVAKQKGVHLQVAVRQGKKTTLEVADLGKTTGIETITSGTAKATVEVAPTFGYMNGDSTGLTSLIGLTAAEAKKLGSKWMSLKAGTTPYSDLKTTVTIPTVTGLLPPAKGTTLTTYKSGGTEVWLLKWTTAATSSAPKLTNVLSIRMGKTALPVKEVTSDSSASETTEFSRWGENVVVHAPSASSTVGYTSIVG